MADRSSYLAPGLGKIGSLIRTMTVWWSWTGFLLRRRMRLMKLQEKFYTNMAQCAPFFPYPKQPIANRHIIPS